MLLPNVDVWSGGQQHYIISLSCVDSPCSSHSSTSCLTNPFVSARLCSSPSPPLVPQVRRLRLHVRDFRVRVKDYGNCDPAGWALEVLKATAPVVEEVELIGPTEMHVLEAHRAPRLTKLHIEGFDNKLPDNGGLVPVLPPLPGPSRLKTLCIGFGSSMRLALLRQLLVAHGHSLEELQFRCEAATDGNAAFVSPSKWLPQLSLPRLGKLYVAPSFLGFGSFSNDCAEDMAYGARVGQLQAGMPHVEVKAAAFFSQDMVDDPVYDFITEREDPDLLFF